MQMAERGREEAESSRETGRRASEREGSTTRGRRRRWKGGGHGKQSAAAGEWEARELHTNINSYDVY